MRRWLLAGVLAWAAAPVAASGQLRPLDPLDWRVWDGSSWVFTAGSAFYSGQRASLAGTDGDLLEVGTLTVALHLDRVVLQAYGTVWRLYDDDHVFAEPLGGAREPDGSRRRDTGDYQIQTIVRLLDESGPFGAAVRFGVRLPTTDNSVGLERDQTDFFALLAGRYRAGRLALAGELGMGVHGTRLDAIEQVDPVLYAIGASLTGGWVRPGVEVVGQWDTRPGSPLRGVEDLAEVRAGVEMGRRRSVSLTAVRGLKESSPDFGVRLTLRAPL